MNLPVENLVIDVGGLLILLLIVIGVLYRVKQSTLHHFFHWKIFSSETKSSDSRIASFFVVLFREVFAFRVLGTCSRGKRLSHLAIFWGFVALAISTTLAYLTNPKDLVLPLYNPVKLFGNGGGFLVIIGFLGMFYVRSREGGPIWRLTRSDVFLLTLLLAVVTGFVTQETIYSSLGSYWVSSSFWIHMVFVIMLLATAPFTKFFHAVSKPVTLLYEEIERKNEAESLLPKRAE
jgi:nitrate reductase gamma subunit